MTALTTDDPHEGETDRRKFDDIASLFGGIVPPPGTPVRSRPTLRTPRRLPDPIGPVSLTAPPRPEPLQDLEHRLPDPPAAPTGLKQPPTPLLRVPAPFQAPPPSGPLPERLPADPTIAAAVADHVADRPEAAPLPRPAERPSKRRGRRSDVPWPDAFEPQPNFRRQTGAQSWALYLLIPLIAVIAIGLFTIDPAVIRRFVDTHFPQLQRPRLDDVPSLVPAPFRAAPGSGNAGTPEAAPPAAQQAAPLTPPGAAPAIPAAPQPSLAEPAQPVAPPAADAPSPPAAPSPTSEEGRPTTGATALIPPALPAPEATPDTPTASAAVPAPRDGEPAPPTPQAEPALQPAPAPPSAVPAAAPSGPQRGPEAESTTPPPATADALQPHPAIASRPVIGRVVVYYRRGDTTSETAGRRIVSQLAKVAGNVELRSTVSSYRAPTVLYVNPADRDSANALARTLGGERSWSVRVGTGRTTAGLLEVWLP